MRANAILTIDTDPNFYSLNLGQAVLITCYELFRWGRVECGTRMVTG